MRPDPPLLIAAGGAAPGGAGCLNGAAPKLTCMIGVCNRTREASQRLRVSAGRARRRPCQRGAGRWRGTPGARHPSRTGSTLRRGEGRTHGVSVAHLKQQGVNKARTCSDAERRSPRACIKSHRTQSARVHLESAQQDEEADPPQHEAESTRVEDSPLSEKRTERASRSTAAPITSPVANFLPYS